jgi:UDP-N-acetylmuramoyl-L-alanyl-D-glutamate--2,6-diaminopimelate ligase
VIAAAAIAPGPLLSELLAGHARVPSNLDRPVAGLAVDSRRVRAGEIFFARRGGRFDGALFVRDAIRAGAVAVVREGPAVATLGAAGTVEIGVTDPAGCLGAAADRFHGAPSLALEVVGVTGTNGKTSVTHFVAQALQLLGPEGGGCGLVGTLGAGVPGSLEPVALTTPDVVDLHRWLAALRDRGLARVAIEASSHAIAQRRLAGVRLRVAVFTNLGRDHLDYHRDLDEYAAAKARLFQAPGLETAVVNLDDERGRAMIRDLPASLHLIGCSLDGAVEPPGVEILRGRLRRLDPEGLQLPVSLGERHAEIRAAVVGRFNAHNLLAALGALVGLGIPLEVAAQALSGVRAPPGRMERFGGGPGQPLVVVDYAHTPEALASVLDALRGQCRGDLVCVFGCGGERDPGKRPQMGAAAAARADRLVLTDDNPRGEDGDAIVAGIQAGLPPGAAARVERDRGRAIADAIAAAAPGDVVLVAGKGHEPWQEVGGELRRFSDAAAVRAALEGRGR